MRLACFALCLSIALAASAEDLGIRAPEQFTVSLFAGDDLAHDIYSMTFDSRGRMVVAGAGYIKTLHDDDGDGRADRVSQFSDKPASGAHGLLFDGGTLYATGDNGIWKFSDADLDGVADGPPEKWVDSLSHREHGCNGIIRGPDGWIYVVCGNDAGVDEKFASTPDSPVTKPNCGAILRFSPDGKESEIMAHGFRNPYDICFHPHGNLFTVDADGERDHHLPWYSPNRLFDVATGMHHGWVLKGWQWSWNRPASYFDNVERCAEIGRGSPTGMLCYRHTQFPEKYRGGIFSACWTMGRIYHYPLTPRGSTFDGKVEVFLETTGETGFAPVDMEVGPDGSMYVAIGGRGTRGSVFKVSYGGESKKPDREPTTPLERILAAPQPLAAWSRAKWKDETTELKQADLESAVLDDSLPSAWRMRATEIVTEFFGGISVPSCFQLATNAENLDTASRKTEQSRSGKPPHLAQVLAARALWSTRTVPLPLESLHELRGATENKSAVVERSFWENIGRRLPGRLAEFPDTSDRRVFAAFWKATAHIPDEEAHRINHLGKYFDGSFDAPIAERLEDFRGMLSAFHAPALGSRDQSAILRQMVKVLGDLHVEPGHKEKLAGYSLRLDEVPLLIESDDEVKSQITTIFDTYPSKNSVLTYELPRFGATLNWSDAKFAERVSNEIGLLSLPTDDIHFLMCLSRMPGERTETARKNIAAGIARLDSKMKARGWYPSRNWPDRVGETFAALAKHDPDLPQEVIEHVAFNSPSQAFLFTRLPDHEAAAARELLKSIAESDEEARWTTDLVTLVAALPKEEALPALRDAWEDFSMQDAIALQLVKSPDEEDRQRFVEALGSIDVHVIEKSADALRSLELKPSDDEILAAVRALRQSCFAPPNRVARQALMRLLASWSGEDFNIKEKGDDHFGRYKPVFEWFELAHPKLAAQLREANGDAASWRARLASVDWTSGDAERGKLIYEKRNCLKCHAGTSPLGPDLAGAAGRLSREDLFTAIVDPSKDVAPLYQATQIVTGSGRVYHGLVVYESPDGTLLTTGPDTTVRIAGDEVTLMRKSRVSLMPTGLLAMAADQELADLYAYLQTLKGKR